MSDDFYTKKEHDERYGDKKEYIRTPEDIWNGERIMKNELTAEDVKKHQRRLHIREDELNLRDLELQKEREEIKKEWARLREAWDCLSVVKSKVVKLLALLNDVP